MVRQVQEINAKMTPALGIHHPIITLNIARLLSCPNTIGETVRLLATYLRQYVQKNGIIADFL